MARQICLALLVIAACCLSSGDYAPIANSTVYSDSKITMNFFVDNTTNNITIYMKFNAYGYFCLEFAGRMANGDYNNIELAPGQVDLLDEYSPGGHDEPEEDASQNLQLLGYDTDQRSYVTVKYTRALNTGDSDDTPLTYGKKYTFSYAWKTGSLVMEFHGNQYKVFSVTLDNNSTGNDNGDDEDDGLNHMDGEEIVHGVLLSIIWMLLVDIGIWIKYLYKLKYRIWMHGALMLLCMGGSIALIVILIAKNKPKLSQLGSDTRAHYVIGIMVLAWVCAQALLGTILQLLLCNKNVPPWFITILRKSHSYSGVILIVLGKVDVILGWAMKSKAVGLGVCCGIGGAVWAAISLYIGLTSGSISKESFEPRKVSKYNDRWVKKFTPQGAKVPAVNSGVMSIMNRPYPWIEVQQSNTFIFDDLVYKIPNCWFHPGGRKIVELTKGREIDRFIYGQFHLQQYPKLFPFQHPKQSMQTVYQPLGILPHNPICQLPTRWFMVQEMINVTPDVEIFYFHPMEGTAYLRRAMNLRHVGQYFTVRAFQHTRLYTCVLCECKANRRLRDSILRAVIPHQIRINTISIQGRVFNKKTTTINNSLDTSSALNGFHTNGFEGIPMIIKRYNKMHAFTRHLFDYPTMPIQIEGLKGRGMCFQAIPDGNIVMIGGGTGIYPYLDLVDAIFKVLVGSRTGLVPADQLGAYNRGLANKTFNFFFSVERPQDLIMPDEMNLINEARSPLANIWVKSKDLGNSFQGRRVKGRFDRQFVSEMIAKLPNLRMVYICGPQAMYKTITEDLISVGITEEYIYYV